MTVSVILSLLSLLMPHLEWIFPGLLSCNVGPNLGMPHLRLLSGGVALLLYALEMGQISCLCQETALTRCTSWRRSGEGVGLGLSGKQLYPATPELTAWQERLADSSQ